MQLHEILKRPLITEKHASEQSAGKYAFEVGITATKNQIKQAVEKAFSVTVTAVNVSRVPGKSKRYGRRLVPPRPWKKAIVTLKPGDSIEIFAGSQV
ncbi:MAG: 50S ribosomal protein L23 [Chloroflexi bacterium]|nr:50S ribosomal protein L23 [Chloroflexota bacterium]